MLVNLVVQLPAELWGAVQRLARESGVLPEQFLATAAAEKVGALTDAKAYFEARAARADLQWFDRFMVRKTGQSPDAETLIAVALRQARNKSSSRRVLTDD